MKIIASRKVKYSLVTVLVVGGVSLASWLFVHTDLQKQNEWVAKSRGLLWPVVCVGEIVTGVTDSIGLGGAEAAVFLRGRSYRGENFYGGMPLSDRGWFVRDFDVLRNAGYMVGYDESSQNPGWVAYRIFEVSNFDHGERPSRFKVDERTYAQVRHDDYKNTGYDRGHMAPNYGIATRYGREAQLETFLMSNIVPQTPELNRKAWKDLELTVARFYGQSGGEVWVITGPIYGKETERLEGGVAIPDFFFKIVVDEKDGNLRALAFIFPQEVRRKQWPRRHLVSIDAIEKATGLDVLAKLPDDVEDNLEAQTATRMWAVPIPLQLKYAFR